MYMCVILLLRFPIQVTGERNKKPEHIFLGKQLTEIIALPFYSGLLILIQTNNH